ncbi:MAG: TIGR04282 family arsenosugar biosynthesis glycosyltransferase [Acidobacteriota bacterium]
MNAPTPRPPHRSPSLRRSVTLFTKPAVPGRVKTRLHPALGAEGAARFHEALLGDVLETLRGGPWSLTVAWALTAGEVPPALDGAHALRQEGEDLGARLHHALSVAARDHEVVAAVGSDHPELAAATVEDAFACLDAGSDVVFGPVDDGGYFLVAARADVLTPELFRDIPWSTEAVLETSLERAAARALRVELLPPGHDIDRPDDLDALEARLGEPGAAPCPRTRAFLRTRTTKASR